MQKIILATTSPYRQQIFKNIGIDFEAIGSDVEEKFEGRPNSPEELVQELAKQKAQAVAAKCSSGLVIGFDSIGFFENEILEKPTSHEEITERLKKLSGNTFYFYTGVHLIDIESKNELNKFVVTEAHMRDISQNEIEKYLAQDEKYKTYALGFDPLGNYASTFIKEIKGSYNNLLYGLPTENIMEMLKEASFEIK